MNYSALGRIKFLSLIVVSILMVFSLVSCNVPTTGTSSLVSSAEPTPTDVPSLGDNLRAISTNGFGETTNIDCGGRFIDTGDYMFTGADNLTKGTQIYRSSDKGETWEMISDYGVNGNKLNQWTSTVVWYNDMLYIGTWQASTGAMLFRANADAENPDDIVWEVIEPNGFDNPNNNGFTNGMVFDGYIYVGCFNLTEGSEVWRSKTGDAGSWEMCIEKSWGRQDNSDTTVMYVYDGYLYAGTESVRGSAANQKGTGLYRTAGGDGEIVWEQVNPDGYGDAKNNNTGGMVFYDGYFYAGTWNFDGMEVWRSDMQGELPWAWERVYEKGGGLPGNDLCQGLQVYDDEIYLIGGGNYQFIDGSGSFFMSPDGEEWTQIKSDEFMKGCSGVMWMIQANDKIYMTLVSLDGNGQMWVYEKD